MKCEVCNYIGIAGAKQCTLTVEMLTSVQLVGSPLPHPSASIIASTKYLEFAL